MDFFVFFKNRMTSNWPDGKYYSGMNEGFGILSMQMKNDTELLEAYAESNNPAAFAELVSRYGSMVYRACFRTLINRQDAEDASQAVFMV